MRIIRMFLLTTIAVAFSFAHAASDSYATTNSYVVKLHTEAQNKKLWQQAQWLNLAHYDVIKSSPDRYISQVDDDRFFTANDGKTNPEAELLATIQSFFRTDVEGDDHAQCRFIARLEWLREQLDFDISVLPKVVCKDFTEWHTAVNAQSVTMIFPAYHLNSPSSMFGHTLLRLDKSGKKEWSEWLSFSVNFGADLDNADNTLFYAVKGLTGGYRGIFIVTPYFKKIREYNRIENRDIWEYRLNLNPEETQRMILHLWELKEINFDYFFFDENCSYRLLELLEVARPGLELTEEFVMTTIPVDTVRAIERAGLIESTQYRPSQASALQNLLDIIPEEDHSLVQALANDISLIDSSIFISLSQDRQKNIVDAAYKYIRYQQTSEERDEVKEKHSYKLLELLNSYPASPAHKINIKDLTPPEKSHDSRRFTVGAGERFDKSFAEFGLKLSFHNLEDNEKGFLRGAQINLGDFRFRTDKEGTTRLHKLDLVNIFSLTPRTQFFNPLSWRVYTGMERQLTNGRDRLVSHVTGGAGVAYELFKGNIVYGLATLRLEHNNGFEHTIEPAVGLNAGILQHFGSNTAHLELTGEQFEGSIYRVRANYKHNFVISRNHSLKITALREWQAVDRFNEFNLSYHYYFK